MFNKDYFDFDLFDDVFDPFFAPRKARTTRSLQSPNSPQNMARGAYMMKTDIEKTDNGYELSMDLPGFDKKDITVETKNGYLTISAVKTENNEETDKEKNYVHKERFYGKTSRSFYIGNGVNQNDIKASYTDGVLKLSIPEAEAQQKTLISVE